MADTVEIVPKGDLYMGAGHAPFPPGQPVPVPAGLAAELRALGLTVEPETASAPQAETETPPAAPPVAASPEKAPEPAPAPAAPEPAHAAPGPEIRGIAPAA